MSTAEQELDDLLNELEAAPENKEPEPEPEPESEPVVEELVADTQGENTQGEDTQLVEQKKLSTSVVTLDLSKVVGDHDRDYSEAVKNLRVDRTKIDTFISMLMDKMDNNNVRASEVESLGRALDTQVNSTQCLVRLMDSRSKLIAALRGHLNNTTITPGANGGAADSETDLENMLSQKDDEA